MMTGNGIAYAGTPGILPTARVGWDQASHLLPLRPLFALLRFAGCMPGNQLGWQLKIAVLRNKTNPFREMDNPATSIYPRPCGAGPMLPPGMNSAG
jgi:hypothetical protein